ncbi:restriction endonuclease subunit S [Endozoicomonas sp. 2B-B]
MSWPEHKLSDFFEITSSKRVFKSEWKSSGVPFYRAREVVKLAQSGAVENELFISEEMYAEYKQKYGVPQPGDILVTGVGTLGRVYIVREGDKFYFKDGNIIWLKKKKEIDSKFVEYAFKTPKVQEFIQNSPGATVGTYTITKANETKIPVPPLPEQKRIAAILDKADQLRRKRQQAIELADEFLRSVFLDMFGDPVTNPKGWEVKPLGSLIAEKDRMNYGVVQPGDHDESGIPVIRVGDMVDGEIDSSSLKRVSGAIDEKHKKSRIKGNEILIACVGSIGKVALVNKLHVGMNIVRAVTRVPIGPSIDREYVFRYLQSPYIQDYFLRKTRTVSQPTLNVGLISETPILIPDQKVQDEYLAIVKRTMSIRETAKLGTSEVTELFNSLSQKAFAGEL